MRGHDVDFGMPKTARKGRYDWVRTGSINSPAGVEFARKIGAKVHVHLEGVAYWRVGVDKALDWGYDEELTDHEIEQYKWWYRSWMNAAYKADSCSVNGANQIKVIQDILFKGTPLPNCHKLSCGADARFALSLPDVKKEDYMVTVSRLEPNKKVFMIAQALALLDQSKLPTWVIVGYGNPVDVRMLKSFCKENKIKMILKPCFGAEKWMWIKKSKLMLCGWCGIPPAEGILCGTPVISFAHPDIFEMYDYSLKYSKDIEVYARHIALVLSYYQPDLIDAIKLFIDRTRMKLLNGELYATTQELLAKKYEEIFEGENI